MEDLSHKVHLMDMVDSIMKLYKKKISAHIRIDNRSILVDSIFYHLNNNFTTDYAVYVLSLFALYSQNKETINSSHQAVINLACDYMYEIQKIKPEYNKTITINKTRISCV